MTALAATFCYDHSFSSHIFIRPHLYQTILMISTGTLYIAVSLCRPDCCRCKSCHPHCDDHQLAAHIVPKCPSPVSAVNPKSSKCLVARTRPSLSEGQLPRLATSGGGRRIAAYGFRVSGLGVWGLGFGAHCRLETSPTPEVFRETRDKCLELSYCSVSPVGVCRSRLSARTGSCTKRLLQSWCVVVVAGRS